MGEFKKKQLCFVAVNIEAKYGMSWRSYETSSLQIVRNGF
jgi:hypothetical protein